MPKKAQGLPLNVIIIAAIALIVLVVLVLIFTGRMGIFTGGLKSCTARGGVCDSPTNPCTVVMLDITGDGEAKIGEDYRIIEAPLDGDGTNIGCDKEEPVCCIGLGK